MFIGIGLLIFDFFGATFSIKVEAPLCVYLPLTPPFWLFFFMREALVHDNCLGTPVRCMSEIM